MPSFVLQENVLSPRGCEFIRRTAFRGARALASDPKSKNKPLDSNILVLVAFWASFVVRCRGTPPTSSNEVNSNRMKVDVTEKSEPGRESKPIQVNDPILDPSDFGAVDQSAQTLADLPAPKLDEGGGYQRLDPRYVLVERIAGVIVGLCIGGPAILGFGIWLAASWPPGFVYWISLAGLVVALGLLSWAIYSLPAAEHRRASWRLSESGLEIRRGIFWRREITVPRARVQHTDVQQGPLQRQYGIAKLVVHTAGTVAASVELSGLSLPIAKWLRDALIDDLRGKSDAV